MSAVSEEIVMKDRMNIGVHIGLRDKDRVIQDPGEERECSSADFTVQHGSGQFRIGSVQIFHFHFRMASNWD